MDTKDNQPKPETKADETPSCCGGDHAPAPKTPKQDAPKAESKPKGHGSGCCS
jgi:hypothetical protein